jgi:flagellar hook-length control protein FliK
VHHVRHAAGATDADGRPRASDAKSTNADANTGIDGKPDIHPAEACKAGDPKSQNGAANVPQPNVAAQAGDTVAVSAVASATASPKDTLAQADASDGAADGPAATNATAKASDESDSGTSEARDACAAGGPQRPGCVLSLPMTALVAPSIAPPVAEQPAPKAAPSSQPGRSVGAATTAQRGGSIAALTAPTASPVQAVAPAPDGADKSPANHPPDQTGAAAIKPQDAASNDRPAAAGGEAPRFDVTAAAAAATAPNAPGGAGAPQPAPAAATARPDTTAPVAVPISGLAVAIASRAVEGKRRFDIRLDPPDLGRIDVRLDVGRDGQVTSRLVVERADTLDLLRRDAPALEQALQSAGLQTDTSGLQFSLRDQSSGGSPFSNPTPRPQVLIVPDEDVAVRAAVQRGYSILRGLGRGVDIEV